MIEFQDPGEDGELRMGHCEVQTVDGECQAWSDPLPG